MDFKATGSFGNLGLLPAMYRNVQVLFRGETLQIRLLAGSLPQTVA